MSKLVSIQELKNKLDVLKVASQYCELKKINATTYKATLNPLRDEKTSSLHFYTDTQKFYDFGSCEGGDALDFISKVENISLSDVISRFSKESYMPTPRPIKKEPLQATQAVEVSSEQLQREFNTFERINPSDIHHKEELLAINPYWLYDIAQKEDIDLFLSVTRYDRKNNTLVSGWYKNSLLDFEIITYKRRRLNSGKWINRKATHPNQTAFSRVYDESKPVYIIEGARDALTAVLLGLNFIAIPTTSYKNFDDLNAYIKPYDEVILLCEDMQGYKAMKLLSQNIIAQKVSLKTFITTPTDKVDLSDFVAQCNNISEVQDAISA